MFLNKKATSIVEVMVIMLILVSGIVGMYKVYSESENLSTSTKNKITAIQIAREGIEAMKNIRDTNWILFSTNTENCWNTLNYKIECVNNNPDDIANDISIGSYKIYSDSNNRWILNKKSTSDTKFSEADYRNEMKVGIDSNGFYTQSGAIKEITPTFTREIKIEYIDDGRTPNEFSIKPTNEQKMKIYSIVQWVDSSSSKPHKVEFSTILTNWKK